MLQGYSLSLAVCNYTRTLMLSLNTPSSVNRQPAQVDEDLSGYSITEVQFVFAQLSFNNSHRASCQIQDVIRN